MSKPLFIARQYICSYYNIVCLLMEVKFGNIVEIKNVDVDVDVNLPYQTMAILIPLAVVLEVLDNNVIPRSKQCQMLWKIFSID